jgi:hypothetical protein
VEKTCSSKRRSPFNELHGLISQKTEFLYEYETYIFEPSYPARNGSLLSTIAVKETNERALYSFWTENEFKIPRLLTETKINLYGLRIFSHLYWAKCTQALAVCS